MAYVGNNETLPWFDEASKRGVLKEENFASKFIELRLSDFEWFDLQV